MEKKNLTWRDIPGWAVMLAVIGTLYLTGLHTEVIGGVQRVLLATGIKNASLTKQEATATDKITSSNTGMAGAGFTMQQLDGQTVSFESLKGKVIFLNIWATWCPPCLAEMPDIQRLYEKTGSDEIAFVMLSVDKSGLDKVKPFIQKKGYTFPVYVAASSFPEEFNSSSIPTTFIISPEGNIVARQEGMAAYDTEEVRTFLLNLTKKK